MNSVRSPESSFLGGDTVHPIREVADFLRVSDKTVRRLISEGKLPAIKLRGKVIIRRRDVDALFEPTRR